MKLSQRYFAIIMLVFCFLFLGEPLAIIGTTIAYAYLNPLSRVSERIITSLTS